jgi:hypothetical protein
MDIRLNYIILQSIEGHEHIFLAHDGKEMSKKTVKEAHAAPPPLPLPILAPRDTLLVQKPVQNC